MHSRLPPEAAAFTDLYARLEHVLRRNGYARKDRQVALIDWVRFARDLGEDFFLRVRNSENAQTLIGEPPRIYYRDEGLVPDVQMPITSVTELFLRGVCQVRDNLVHGEKYVRESRKRDDDLVRDAHWVLEEAIKLHPQIHALVRLISSATA